MYVALKYKKQDQPNYETKLQLIVWTIRYLVFIKLVLESPLTLCTA